MTIAALHAAATRPTIFSAFDSLSLFAV